MLAEFEIIGKPGAKGRPRFTKYGKTYTDEKTVNYENLVKLSYQNQVNGKFGEDEELSVLIHAYFPIPKSTSKKQKDMMINYQRQPTVKPDCDNIAKVILDSLNNVAYKDDSQVVELTVAKFYSDNPRVEVIIQAENSEQLCEH
jgi:Holliday junction resolvase RusA-like endonuclease